jgi:hypothetical protein
VTADEKPEEVLSRTARSTGFARRDLYALAAIVVGLGGLGLVMNGVWLTSGIFAGITALVVMGMVLLTGYGGQLSLGQGAPTAGRITHRGTEITGFAPERINGRGVGRTFQNVRPFAELSVRENIMMGAYGAGFAGVIASAFRLGRYRELERRSRPSAPTAGSPASASPTTPACRRRRCRSASSASPRLPAPWPATPISSCSTSRRLVSIRWRRHGCRSS